MICPVCKCDTKYTGFKILCKEHIIKVHGRDSLKQLYDLEHPGDGICKDCGKEKTFIGYNKGYKRYCSDLFCRCSSKELLEKSRKTKLEKYGDPYYVNKEKANKTMVAKYGKIFTNREKFKETWSKKSKDEHVLAHELSKKTRFERYGNENYVNKDMISQRRNEKYINHIIVKFKEFDITYINYKNYNVEFLCNKCANKHELNTKFISSRVKYDITPCITCQPINDHVSSGERDVHDFIKSIYNKEIIPNNREHGFEIDIYLPELKLGIEFNGDYWHSAEIKSRMYHYDKANKCDILGIRLIQIFEHEWLLNRELVKSKLRNIISKDTKRLFARKCDVIVINDTDIQRAFLDNNHLQGYCRSKIAIGLAHQNEIVALMCFDRPRVAKKYEWELVRYATNKDLSVVGGGSKLLSYFIKNYNPISIISYADRFWSSGNLYEKIGFIKDGVSLPSYFYLDKVTRAKFHRFSLNKDKLKRMGVLKDTETEDDAITALKKYFKIYDCGKIRYVWKI